MIPAVAGQSALLSAAAGAPSQRTVLYLLAFVQSNLARQRSAEAQKLSTALMLGSIELAWCRRLFGLTPDVHPDVLCAVSA